MNKILNGANTKLSPVGLFLDFQNAFDTLDHRIFLNKLDKMGISGVANTRMRNFATDGNQMEP